MILCRLAFFVLPMLLCAQTTTPRATASFVIYAGGDTVPDNIAVSGHPSLLFDFRARMKDKTLFSVNLEGSFCAEANEAKKCTSSNCHTLIFDSQETIPLLKQMGVDHTVIANNHALDCGSSGHIKTQRKLQEAKIAFSGSHSTPYTIIERNGRKIALLSMGANRSTASFNNLAELKPVFAELAAKRASGEIALWIVNLHIGTEGFPASLRPSGAEEIYLGEKRGNPKAIARMLIDRGADLIIGHGPHVPRGLDLYKNRLIAYSLGNFLTDFGISTKAEKGLSPLLRAVLNENGEFVEGEIIPLEQQSHHYPVLDPKAKVCRLMSTLTAELTHELSFVGCHLLSDTKGSSKR